MATESHNPCMAIHPSPTQPLREEHKELLPHIEQLRTAADMVGEAPSEETRRAVDEAYGFLVGHLIPHAQAEDARPLPVVERVMGAPEATATMRRDHVEVGRLTGELGALQARLAAGGTDPALTRDLRRVLYGLYALVGVHFAKRRRRSTSHSWHARLAPEAAVELFQDMEAAAEEAKRRAVATCSAPERGHEDVPTARRAASLSHTRACRPVRRGVRPPAC